MTLENKTCSCGLPLDVIYATEPTGEEESYEVIGCLHCDKNVCMIPKCERCKALDNAV